MARGPLYWMWQPTTANDNTIIKPNVLIACSNDIQILPLHPEPRQEVLNRLPLLTSHPAIKLARDRAAMLIRYLYRMSLGTCFRCQI